MHLNHKKKSKEEIFSVIGLLVVAICWGFGFLGLRYVDGLPTFYVQAIRFGIAALALAAVFFKHLKNVDKELLKAGILIGILMFACYVCATLGIKYTTASRTAFFSTLGAICVPLLNFVIYRIRLTRKSALCVVICVVGVYLISMGGSASLGFNIGDAICLGAAFFSAGQIVTIEKFAKSHDVYALTIIELATISVLGFAGIFVAGEAVPQALTGLELGTLILLGLVCSALCFILQTTAQKHVAANRVALILTVEPVVGAAASVMILHETLGIVGFGRIGQHLGVMAKAIGMNVIAFDIFHIPGIEEQLGIPYVEMDELLAKSDFISVHAPAVDGGALINAERIAKMKDGVCIINTSRGTNVDEAALLDALNSGKVRAAGLDVYADEPASNAALYSHPMVSCTPHIGAATVEAQKRIGAEIVDIITNFGK